MIRVRDAEERDVEAVREIFLATYSKYYAYPQYYDPRWLRKMIYGDDTLLLVAEDEGSRPGREGPGGAPGRILGTASVVLHVGAHADLVGEFGRLAVHPDARGHGVGSLLMRGRLERVRDRLHVGIVENRASHTFSQRISLKFGFAPVGFLPQKLLLQERESVALYARYFGDALRLRKNHPRVIPEAATLAELALGRVGCPRDYIVDATAPPLANECDFELQDLDTEGYADLLRIERGRVRQREIFGPLRLHYGLFQLRARRSSYLIARVRGQIAGAVGYTVDPIERTARIFEVVAVSDDSVRFLLEQLIVRCRDRLAVDYVETDVSAYSPSMQRTLLELDFLPVAYIPAMVFHDVERLDAIKMARLLAPCGLGQYEVCEAGREIAQDVVERFQARCIEPRIAAAAAQLSLLAGLSEEQMRRVAGICQLEQFSSGEMLITPGGPASRLLLLLGGTVELRQAAATQRESSSDEESTGRPLGEVGPGQCLGETALLAEAALGGHQLAAQATSPVTAAALTMDALDQLVRRRPDIGVVLYRNLANSLGAKLRQADLQLMSPPASRAADAE